MMNVQETSAKKTVDLGELDKLAKLLATENITVEHRNVSTAYFDTKNRQLILPIWKDLTKELYHMLVLHEVGHAIYTTPDAWEKVIVDNPKIKPALNVVEDARIERLMKDRYPGSRRDFRLGYQMLHERDFFQLVHRNISKLNLGDRLNLHFKIGENVFVPFRGRIETAFVSAISQSRSFDEAIMIAEQLIKHLNDEEVDEEFIDRFAIPNITEDEDFDEDEDDDNDEGEGFNDDDDGFDESYDDGSYEFYGDEGNDRADPGEETEEGSSGASLDNQTEKDKSKISTVESLERSLRGMTSNVKPAKIYDVYSSLNHDRWIIDYKTILKHNYATTPHAFAGSQTRYLRRKNLRCIDYLIKEFLVHKAADGYQRAREAKTGVINTDKLHNYKLIDDIFKRNTVIPENKNHGIVMFIDFSGSMHYDMANTVEQLYNLVMFCRKVNIPHRVYAFTDSRRSFIKQYNGTVEDTFAIDQEICERKIYLNDLTKRSINAMIPNPEMNLLELFHEKMTTREFNDMLESILHYYPIEPNFKKHAMDPYVFSLNGTPLDGCVLLSASILKKFKETTNSEIVSAVYLTDGDSSGFYSIEENSNKTNSTKGIESIVNNYSCSQHQYKIRDYNTKKTINSFRVGLYDNCSTGTLIRWISSIGGYHTVCYRLIHERQFKYQLAHNINIQYTDVQKIMAQFRAMNCVSKHDFFGYDLFNAIKSTDRYNTTSEQEFEVSDKATKDQIAKSFIKTRSKRLNDRIVLQNFAKTISAKKSP